MTLSAFIEQFKSQFALAEESDIFLPDTEFKKLKAYDSLTALLVIAMIDEEYEVAISGNDIRASKTIEDLFELIKSKL